MGVFRDWCLEEMAQFSPQHPGDTHDRGKTTHLGFPVWAPTIYHILVNRDLNKFPDGMSSAEIAKELIEKSELRNELLPRETMPQDPNMKGYLSSPEGFSRFKQNIEGNMNKARKDGMIVGKTIPKVRVPGEPGQRGRQTVTLWAPSEVAIKRKGTGRVGPREKKPEAKKIDFSDFTAISPQGPEASPPIDMPELPPEMKGKELEDLLGTL